MSDKKSIRLNKLTKELNVGIDRILAFLAEKGHDGFKPTSKVSDDIYQLLSQIETKRIEDQYKVHKKDRYHIFLWIAFIMLLANS